MAKKKQKIYSIRCKKGEPTRSRPCFITFGSGKRKQVGEVLKRTEKNTIGNKEDLVLIKFTAGASQTQQDVIDTLKRGHKDLKIVKRREREFFGRQ